MYDLKQSRKKAFLLSGEDHAGMFAVTAEVGTKINISYDMTYFDTQETHSIMPTNLFANISK